MVCENTESPKRPAKNTRKPRAWGMSGPVRIQEQNRAERRAHLRLSRREQTTLRHAPVAADQSPLSTTAQPHDACRPLAALATACRDPGPLCPRPAAQAPHHPGGFISMGIPDTLGRGSWRGSWRILSLANCRSSAIRRSSILRRSTARISSSLAPCHSRWAP